VTGVNSIAGVTLHFHRIKPVKAGVAADARGCMGQQRYLQDMSKIFGALGSRQKYIALYHHSVSNTRAGELSYPYN